MRLSFKRRTNDARASIETSFPMQYMHDSIRLIFVGRSWSEIDSNAIYGMPGQTAGGEARAVLTDWVDHVLDLPVTTRRRCRCRVCYFYCCCCCFNVGRYDRRRLARCGRTAARSDSHRPVVSLRRTSTHCLLLLFVVVWFVRLTFGFI
jgi:hypothetical protein